MFLVIGSVPDISKEVVSAISTIEGQSLSSNTPVTSGDVTLYIAIQGICTDASSASQLTPSPCPLMLLLSLLVIKSVCPVELLPSPVATPIACELVAVSMLEMTHIASLLCPMVPPNPVHLAIIHPAHPTGSSFVLFFVSLQTVFSWSSFHNNGSYLKFFPENDY